MRYDEDLLSAPPIKKRAASLGNCSGHNVTPQPRRYRTFPINRRAKGGNCATSVVRSTCISRSAYLSGTRIIILTSDAALEVKTVGGLGMAVQMQPAFTPRISTSWSTGLESLNSTFKVLPRGIVPALAIHCVFETATATTS
jgi:hypothetical protein